MRMGLFVVCSNNIHSIANPISVQVKRLYVKCNLSDRTHLRNSGSSRKLTHVADTTSNIRQQCQCAVCTLSHTYVHKTVFYMREYTNNYDWIWFGRSLQGGKKLLCFVFSSFVLIYSIENTNREKKLINHRIFIYFLTFLFIDLHRLVRRRKKRCNEQDREK